MHVYTTIPESTYLKFKRLEAEGKLPKDSEGRLSIGIQLDHETDFPHPGWIESFDNRINPATGSLSVRSIVPNKDGIIPAGAFIRARLPTTASYEAIMIDDRVIQTEQTQKYVNVLGPNNTAEYRAIVPGPTISGKRLIRELRRVRAHRIYHRTDRAILQAICHHHCHCH